jgi:hypothetical protein
VAPRRGRPASSTDHQPKVSASDCIRRCDLPERADLIPLLGRGPRDRRRRCDQEPGGWTDRRRSHSRVPPEPRTASPPRSPSSSRSSSPGRRLPRPDPAATDPSTAGALWTAFVVASRAARHRRGDKERAPRIRSISSTACSRSVSSRRGYRRGGRTGPRQAASGRSPGSS